jgi:Rrf2 family iron-sulfur cluster assembly transcriptional regulator
MLISTRSRYGFRALAQLARKRDGVPVSLSRIAEDEMVPIRYLEQIFGKLRASGIVAGRRGPGGGYVLCRPPGEITLLEVVEILEKNFLPVDCLDDSNECGVRIDPETRTCVLQDRCVTRPLWMMMRTGYQEFLRSNSLEDLLQGRLKPCVVTS